MAEDESLENLFEGYADDALKDKITHSLLRDPVFSSCKVSPNRATLDQLDSFYKKHIALFLGQYMEQMKKDEDSQNKAIKTLVKYIRVTFDREEYSAVLNSFNEVIKCLDITFPVVFLSLTHLVDADKEALVKFLTRRRALTVLKKNDYQ